MEKSSVAYLIQRRRKNHLLELLPRSNTIADILRVLIVRVVSSNGSERIAPYGLILPAQLGTTVSPAAS